MMNLRKSAATLFLTSLLFNPAAQAASPLVEMVRLVERMQVDYRAVNVGGNWLEFMAGNFGTVRFAVDEDKLMELDSPAHLSATLKECVFMNTNAYGPSLSDEDRESLTLKYSKILAQLKSHTYYRADFRGPLLGGGFALWTTECALVLHHRPSDRAIMVQGQTVD